MWRDDKVLIVPDIPLVVKISAVFRAIYRLTGGALGNGRAVVQAPELRPGRLEGG